MLIKIPETNHVLLPVVNSVIIRSHNFNMIKIRMRNEGIIENDNVDVSEEDAFEYAKTKMSSWLQSLENVESMYANNIKEYCKLLRSRLISTVVRAYNHLDYAINDEYLIIFSPVSHTDSRMTQDRQVLIVYKFENEYIKNILLSLYPITEDLTRILKETTPRNNHHLFDPNILELLVNLKILEATNTPVYNHFQKRFPNGKIRTLSEPNETIIQQLKFMNNSLYNIYGDVNPECQCAYKKGKSIKNNALPHKDNRYIFKADIEDFFPSCERDLVRKVLKPVFKYCINSEVVMEYFLDCVLVDNALCLGNPISPVIANQIVSKPSRYIYNMCRQTGIVFTQYCDDLTFSSSRPISKDYVVRIFNEAYTTYHLESFFHLKERKLIGQVGQYRNVTGVAFDHTDNNSLTVKRSMYRNLRVAIHKLSLGENVNLNKVRGQIAYMAMIGKGRRILNYIEKFPGLREQLIGPRLLEKILQEEN